MTTAQINDSMQSVIAGLNGPGGHVGSGPYMAPLGDQLIQASNAFRTSWLFKRCIDIPSFEMTRAGRDWQAEKADIEKLEAEEKRLGLWEKLRAALIGGDMGGAALILGDGTRDPSKPIKARGVGSLKYIHVVYRGQITLGEPDLNIDSDNFGKPAWFELIQSNGQPNIRLHPSRVVVFKGQPIVAAGNSNPSTSDLFWGDPVWTALCGVITNADVAQAGVSSLVNQAKNETVTVPGLKNILMAEDQGGSLVRRFTVANQLRNLTSTTIIDGGDPNIVNSGEKWETRQLSFATLPELMQTFVGFVAGARGIPKTILLGDTPGGLNTTGKGEQREFERRIEAQQSADLKPALEQIDPLLIESALGSVPADIYWEFAPLSNLSEVESSEVNKRNAETAQIYVNTGLVPVEALAKGVQNKLVEDGVYPGLDAALDEADDLDIGALEDVPEDDLVAPEPVPVGDAISTDDQALIAEAVSRAENPSAIRKLLSWAFGRE